MLNSKLICFFHIGLILVSTGVLGANGNSSASINSLKSLSEKIADGVWLVEHQFNSTNSTHGIVSHSVGRAWSTASVSTINNTKMLAICGRKPSAMSGSTPLFITSGLFWDFNANYQVVSSGSEIRIIHDNKNQLILTPVSNGSMSHGSVKVSTTNAALGFDEPNSACLYIRELSLTNTFNGVSNVTHNFTYSVNFPVNASFSQLTLTQIQNRPSTGKFSLFSPSEASVTVKGEGLSGEFIDCNIMPLDKIATVTFTQADYKSVNATFSCKENWGNGTFEVSGNMKATLPN